MIDIYAEHYSDIHAFMNYPKAKLICALFGMHGMNAAPAKVLSHPLPTINANCFMMIRVECRPTAAGSPSHAALSGRAANVWTRAPRRTPAHFRKVTPAAVD